MKQKWSFLWLAAIVIAFGFACTTKAKEEIVQPADAIETLAKKLIADEAYRQLVQLREEALLQRVSILKKFAKTKDREAAKSAWAADPVLLKNRQMTELFIKRIVVNHHAELKLYAVSLSQVYAKAVQYTAVMDAKLPSSRFRAGLAANSGCIEDCQTQLNDALLQSTGIALDEAYVANEGYNTCWTQCPNYFPAGDFEAQIQMCRDNCYELLQGALTEIWMRQMDRESAIFTDFDNCVGACEGQQMR